jgi:outer membrane protein TolC
MNAGIERRTRQLLSRKIPLAALLLLVIGVQCQPAEAQNEQSGRTQAEGALLPTALPGSENLTLAAAVDLALKQNLDIQIANTETAMRQQDRVVARSELLPHASFEVDDRCQSSQPEIFAWYSDSHSRRPSHHRTL